LRSFRPGVTEKEDAQIPGFNEKPGIHSSCRDPAGLFSSIADPGGLHWVLVAKLTHAGASRM
jgi:hypothetical protein